MLCPVSVFATDVSGGETCDTDVLNTDTGPVNLRAEFEPETINLRWYNGNTRLTVPNTSNTCIYDTAISLPANPTKPGYKFKGWKIINILTILDYTENAIWDANHTRWKNNNGYTMQSVYGIENSDDLNNGEWAVTFSYGTVKGKTLCSISSGTVGQPGMPNISSNGKYCWCSATEYQANASSVWQNVLSSTWGNIYSYDDAG